MKVYKDKYVRSTCGSSGIEPSPLESRRSYGEEGFKPGEC